MSNETTAVLSRVAELIRDRGWTVRFSNGPGSPLNLRCAISAACTELTDSGSHWHHLYSETVNELSRHLKDGIISWEFGTHASPPRRRTQAEVERELAKLINRLETREAKNQVRTGSGGRSGGAV